MLFRENLRKLINALGKDNLGEFLGTVIFLVAKQGCIAVNVTSSADLKLLSCLGIGFGVMVGFYVANSVGGGQLNSGVTLALCTIGHVKWRKLPIFAAIHFIACFVSSFTVYGLYYQRIKLYNISDEASIHILTTTQHEGISVWTIFFEQFLAMATTMIGVLTIIDRKSPLTNIHFHSLMLGLMVAGVLLTFSATGSLTIHPNLDIVGRIVASIVGYSSFVWSFPYCIIPPIALCVGGLFGTFIYQVMVGVWIKENTETDPKL